MLPYDQLAFAIDIHQRSYNLLRWIESTVDMRQVHTPQQHAEDRTLAVYQWLSEAYPLLPANILPERHHLEALARYFSTYLVTSFNFVQNPHPIRKSLDGCLCDMCCVFVKGKSLQPKRVYPSDKKRAEWLMLLRLEDLGREESLVISKESEQDILHHDALYRNLAISAYGYWMLQRLEGFTDGVSVLALWRMMAKDKAGLTIPNFQLNVELFAKSEQLLVAHLRLTS